MTEPVDLSRLSIKHLEELQAAGGDITKLSDDTLNALTPPPERSTGTTIARHVGLAAQGVNDAFLPTLIGAPVDLVAGGMRAAGIPVNDPFLGSKSIKRGIDYVATLPGRVRDAASLAFERPQLGKVHPSFAPFTEDRTSRITPETAGERFTHGAGEGVGGALATILPAGVVARGAQAGTTTQQIAEVLASQPGMQGLSAAAGGGTTEATGNPYLGMAAALATPVAAGGAARLVTPMGPTRNAAEVERRRLVDAARSRGIPLTTGQISGSKGLQTLESVLENLPFSGGMQRGLIDRQRQAFNQEVTAGTGAPLPAFTRAERELRRDHLGQQFENLAQGTTVNLDGQFNTQLNDALARYRQQLTPDVYRNVEQRLQELMSASTTPGNLQIPGEVYQRIRSSLGRQATQNGNTETSAALREARNALDAAARRSLPPDVAQHWDEVRRQWGNLRTIEAGMQNADAAVGNIAPRALGAAVDSANRRGGARSLTEIADIGRKILAPQIADSGTAQRGFWQRAATLGEGGALAGGGFAAGGLGGAAAALATPPLVQMLLENPATRAYAGNHMLGNTPTLPSREMVTKLGLVQALLAAKGEQ